MMKILLMVLAGLLVLALLALFALGVYSRSGQALGLAEGKLQPCPNKPNCVNSETTESNDHQIQPFSATNGDIDALWAALTEAVKAGGGNIMEQTDDYLAAQYRSRWFGFVDDLELRRDNQSNIVHVRSASRVGRKDFDANKMRVEQLRAELVRKGVTL